MKKIIKLMTLLIGIFVCSLQLIAEGIIDETPNAPHYYFNTEEEFHNAIRANAPNYRYIFIFSRQESSIYYEHQYNQIGNTFINYLGDVEYRAVLRNDDPGYFAEYRRFNSNQVEAAISYYAGIIAVDTWGLFMQLAY